MGWVDGSGEGFSGLSLTKIDPCPTVKEPDEKLSYQPNLLVRSGRGYFAPTPRSTQPSLPSLRGR